ncbi:MAG: pseudouridine synthase [Candidatus Berkiellales bacterium]
MQKRVRHPRKAVGNLAGSARRNLRLHALTKEHEKLQSPIIKQRIHKLLANAGLGSRRTIEQWIMESKIKVNGKTATLGQIVSTQDQIEVEGKRIDLYHYTQTQTRVLLYNKPEGEICARHSHDGKKSVYDNLPKLKQGKWVSVGRLDVNTSGLLLFTNNGDLAHRLMHPRFQIERQYLVRVLGKVNENTLICLKEGVKLEEGFCRFSEIIQKEASGANQWFIVSLMEGKYREVRKLWGSQGCVVSRLVRIKYGNIDLPRRLRKGQWEELPEARIHEELMG